MSQLKFGGFESYIDWLYVSYVISLVSRHMQIMVDNFKL